MNKTNSNERSPTEGLPEEIAAIKERRAKSKSEHSTEFPVWADIDTLLAAYESLRTQLAGKAEIDVKRLARECAYEAGRYFDDLYLASNKERKEGQGFTSAGVKPWELAARLLPIIESVFAEKEGK